MPTLAETPRSDQPSDIPSLDDGCLSLQPELQDEEGLVADLCCSSVQLVVVLLRYVTYCFRSINDTINQNYRDNDTIIL